MNQTIVTANGYIELNFDKGTNTSITMLNSTGQQVTRLDLFYKNLHRLEDAIRAIRNKITENK